VNELPDRVVAQLFRLIVERIDGVLRFILEAVPGTGTGSTPTTSPSAVERGPSEHQAHNTTPREHDALPPDAALGHRRRHAP
jgi:hypothetical protein